MRGRSQAVQSSSFDITSKLVCRTGLGYPPDGGLKAQGRGAYFRASAGTCASASTKKAGNRVIPRPATAASRMIRPLFIRCAERGRAVLQLSGPEKRQSTSRFA